MSLCFQKFPVLDMMMMTSMKSYLVDTFAGEPIDVLDTSLRKLAQVCC